ncbi:MAG: hypothetical protein ACXWOX_21265 [Ktedonobacteraceae bacterium]
MARRFTAITVALIVLLALLIMGQIAATVSWWLVPATQSVISSAQYAGVPTTIAAGTLVAALYFIALIGVLRRRRWGAIVAGATALFDLAIGFFLSATVLYALAGAVLLGIVVILACLEYRRLGSATAA